MIASTGEKDEILTFAGRFGAKQAALLLKKSMPQHYPKRIVTVVALS